MASRSDNFNRADTTNNIGTPSDGGSAWVQYSGTWGIASNTGYQSAAGGDVGALCVLEASSAVVDVQATLPTMPLVNSAGLSVRAADDNNFIIMLVNAQGALAYLYKRVAGTYTQVTSDSASWVSGDVAKLSVTSGNVVTGYRNGSLATTATISNGSSNTQHGLWEDQLGLTARYDEFSITDNGGGGGTPLFRVPLLNGLGGGGRSFNNPLG